MISSRILRLLLCFVNFRLAIPHNCESQAFKMHLGEKKVGVATSTHGATEPLRGAWETNRCFKRRCPKGGWACREHSISGTVSKWQVLRKDALINGFMKLRKWWQRKPWFWAAPWNHVEVHHLCCCYRKGGFFFSNIDDFRLKTEKKRHWRVSWQPFLKMLTWLFTIEGFH